MATININQKNVSDNNNTFFRNNRILIGTEMPLTGDYVRGDIIVNSGSDNDENSMWICIESGSPGDWISIGRKPLITAKARVTITDTVDEVSTEGLGELVEKNDKLDVYLNSTYLLEDEDYSISKDGTKIIKKSGFWNTTKENAIFDFVLMKQVHKIDSDNITINAKTKLTSTVTKVPIIGTQTEVAIPNTNFNKTTDTLLIFKNGMIMINDVDYQISNGNIVSLTGPWNLDNIDDYEMTFVLLKEVAVYEDIEDNLVLSHSHTGEEIKVSSAAGSPTISESFESIEAEVSNLANNSQPATDNNLQTESKTIVGAINEVFQRGNNVKQQLVDTLIAKGIDCSTSDTFEVLIDKINQFADIVGTIKVIRPGDDVTIYNKTTAVRTYDCSYQNITITGLNGDITAGIRFKANIGTVDSDSNTLVFTRVKLLRNDEVMTSMSETLTVPAAGTNYTYDIHYPIQNNDVIKFEFSFNYEDLGSDIANPSIDDPQISINSQIVSYTVKDEEPKDAVLKMIPGDKNLLTSGGGNISVNNGTPGQVTLTIPTFSETFKGATLNITTYAGGDTYYVYYAPTVLLNRNGETIDQLFYPNKSVFVDGDGTRRTISRTLTDLKAGDTIFCQFDITDGDAVTPFPDEYYFVIDNITVTFDTAHIV